MKQRRRSQSSSNSARCAKSVLAVAVVALWILQSFLEARVHSWNVVQQDEPQIVAESAVHNQTMVNGWILHPAIAFPPRTRSYYSGPGGNVNVSIHGQPSAAISSTPKKRVPDRKRHRHPYRGALDEHGNPYVPDVTRHLLDPQPFILEGNETSSICNPPESLQDWIGYQVCQDHLQISTSATPVRLLCVVYTHAEATPKTQAIRQTWGRKCHGLLFASTHTSHSSLHVHIPHDSKWQGGYRGLWQRTRAILALLYQEYLENFDFVHICGDDTYVLVENLQAYLGTISTTDQPFFGGFWTHWGKPDHPRNANGFYYLGGGAGYTLNAKALQMFVEQGPLENCTKNQNDGPAEDVNVAWCFREVLGLVGWDTRDDMGAHRYHVLAPQQHALMPMEKYGMASHIVRQSLTFMERKHGFPFVQGPDYISRHSVAFHNLKTPTLLKRMEFWLYGTGREQCGY